jgi:GTPase SAR1 family protein
MHNKNITLKILDISGESNNSKMLDAYLYKADGIIYIYDISNDDSFSGLDTWLSNVTNYFFKKNKEIP